nr:hypothetical protein BaRGS_004184 [Batillaria attramentaria]
MVTCEGMLYPRDSESRQVKVLDGMWNFLLDTSASRDQSFTNQWYPAVYFKQNLQMDFFNYAGIHRHVHLYTHPTTYVDDINIVTDFKGTQGTVNYEVMLAGTNTSGVGVKVNVLDAGGKVVSPGTGSSETTDTPAYMYTLEIRGKGLDYPLIARDFNMLKWLGANCFRTSHYPYAEEIMDQADQPNNMGEANVAHHKAVMEELVRRDENRPSAVIWSVANEPSSDAPGAEDYFRLRLSRPVVVI